MTNESNVATEFTPGWQIIETDIADDEHAPTGLLWGAPAGHEHAYSYLQFFAEYTAEYGYAWTMGNYWRVWRRGDNYRGIFQSDIATLDDARQAVEDKLRWLWVII